MLNLIFCAFHHLRNQPGCFLIILAFAWAAAPVIAAPVDIPIGAAGLSLQNNGSLGALAFSDGTQISSGTRNAVMLLETPQGQLRPSSVHYTNQTLSVNFPEGSSASFSVKAADKFTLFRLASLDIKTSASGMRLFSLPVPNKSDINGTLNAAFFGLKAFAQMSATPEVLAATSVSRAHGADLAGCSHSIIPSTEAREGNVAAEFTSTCTLSNSGWSMQGVRLEEAPPLASIVGLQAWIHGDAKGEQLKFQFTDEGGGARDYYVPINFTGWRHVEMTSHALNIIKGQKLAGLNLYYNGLPAKTSVTCRIDDIRAIVFDNGTTKAVALEDFEDQNSPWWSGEEKALDLYWDFDHVRVGDGFGIIACPEVEFFDVVQQFEKEAGIIAPRLGGEWNKASKDIQESYLFLTSFKESEFDEAVRLAKRGGFKQILLGQESWCHSTGHYEIKRTHFADGLPGLVRTIERFRAEGIKVGLHLLGASIDAHDPYITPVPDPRLVKGAEAALTADLDSATTTIVVEKIPQGFPAEDGGYSGDGTVLQVGTELIKYDTFTTAPRSAFTGCVRGHHGTRPAAHKAGASLRHLSRSYGYHMHDMDTSLLEEVTSNFAAVANACDIDMVYFDGSERLQGNHSRYNGRLINAYLSKLKRKDILVQASSYSHFSWHQLARTASADGHGDLKGYLEQRSPAFRDYRQTGMPLDVGWYYGYDKSATPDMYEYILGTTIGYNSSFSYQVSVAAAGAHPFSGQILDLVNRYEKLRLSGKVPPEMRERFQVPKELEGKAPEDKTRPTHLRRDYRLVSANGKDSFQRVIYGEWQTADQGSTETQWDVDVTSSSTLLGFQLQALDSPSTGQLVKPTLEVNGQTVECDQTVSAGQYLFLWPGEPVAIYGAPLKETAIAANPAPTIKLPRGTHKIRFRLGHGSTATYRVRTTLQPPGRYEIKP